MIDYPIIKTMDIGFERTTENTLPPHDPDLSVFRDAGAPMRNLLRCGRGWLITVNSRSKIQPKINPDWQWSPASEASFLALPAISSDAELATILNLG
jgi:hypothetical protein